MAGVPHFTILFLLPYFLTVSCAPSNELVVATKNGQVEGKFLPAVDGKVRAFLGIPYAKTPVGNLRFRAPQPADSWEGVKDTTKYGNSCFQLKDEVFPGFSGAEMWNPNTPVSEDCLYVNVWTPCVEEIKSPLPVMVWIHGGAFRTGTASLDLYDGRFFAKLENVVVISMNYRVGAFGFMVLPDNDQVTGNACLLDQRLAIHGVKLGRFLGCTSPVPAELEACMQEVDPFNMTIKQDFIAQGKGFRPVVDGIFLPKSPMELVNDKTIPKKELLLGTNQNEGTYFLVYEVRGFDSSLVTRDVNPWPEWMGVMNGYGIEFVFGRPLVKSLGYTDKEVRMSRRFMKHWANFARTGNPSIGGNQWPPFIPENKEYVTLDTNLPERKTMLKADRCFFWNQFL